MWTIKAKNTYCPTESEEQQLLFEWAWIQKCKYRLLKLLFHIPNEGKRSAATGARMKAEGMRSGVPDLFLPVARKGYHGMFIELKRRRGGVVSKDQQQWIDDLREQGYHAIVCRGFDEAKEQLTEYLKPEKKQGDGDMKIKKIVDICKKTGALYLYIADGEQYVSDGKAIYPLYDMPDFNADTFCKAYDIDNKKADKMAIMTRFELPGGVCLKDVIDAEEITQRSKIKLNIQGGEMLPLITSHGVEFINTKYLSPIESNVEIEFYERTTPEGSTYFAVKSGLILLCAITPEKIITENFNEELKILTRMCSLTFENTKR